eukprot:GAFH01000943.1.p1 GENE.GAFH01000943.1~~GAFH01000943.1.p1  ORF type:complete len:721 (-),score=312.46 GAFH01000943.1:130-2259(-)
MNRFVVGLLLLCASAYAMHTFTVDDMAAIDRITGPIVSPDGNWFLFSSRIWNKAENKVTTLLWVQNINDGTQTRITSGHAVHDTEFAWAPDSRNVFFLSDRSGSNQVWIVDIVSKQTRQLTFYPVDIDSLKASKTGNYISFSANIYPGKSMEETAILNGQRDASRTTAMVFDNLFVRHWDTFLDGTYRHLFTAAVSSQQGFPAWNVSADPLDLINLIDPATPVLGDSPSKPWGGAEEINFSPDGQWIAFSIQLGKEQAWNLNRHVYISRPDGKSIRDITPDFQARANIPVFSPDSKSVAFLATAQPGYESDRNRVKIYNIDAATTTVLTEDWDVSPDALEWSAVDPDHIYALAIEKARGKIYALPAKAQYANGRPVAHAPVTALAVTEVTHEHTVASFQLVPNHPNTPLVMSLSGYTFPTDIFALSGLDGHGNVVQLTSRNADIMSQVVMSTPGEEWFAGAYGDQVHSWFFKPHGWKEGQQYPLILYVHGGPENPWEDSWSFRWNPQAMAAQGYAVLAINFHGSSSFGDAFTRAIIRNWGTAPYEDHMKGLDFILAKYPWIDSNRMGAMGASYGGFHINWLNGHTNRFKALVCHDGVFDTRAHYYETEELYFPETEFAYPPYVNQTFFELYNPANFVAHWQTPTLIVHGSRDYRIPDTQGIGAFTALQRRGIPSRLLLFPDENHWVLNPNNSIRWHQEVIAWMAKWVHA